MKGLVVRNLGNLYQVRVGEKLYVCRLKGNFKLQGIRTTNPIAVGDWVSLEAPLLSGEEQPQKHALFEGDQQPLWIIGIEPRRNYIIRRASNLSKQSHIIGANLDRTLLVVTINYPVTSTTFIDRYLATAEAYGVPALLAFNKIDRYRYGDQLLLEQLVQLYEGIGYPCFRISAKDGSGMEQLRKVLAEGVTLLSGHSGVGKSTLINVLVPDAEMLTQEISEAHNVGVHTTTHSEMILLPSCENVEGEQVTDASQEAYLIDTPGIKGFGTIEFDKQEVGHYFPEIFAQAKQCYYSDCSHTHEPKCAVLEALKRGEIATSRYQSYLSILEEDEVVKYRL